MSKTVVNHGVRIAIFIFLARVLGPEDFGLVTLALTLTILADFLIIEGGWTEALVRRDTATQEHYDSVFWLVLSIAVLLAVIMGLFASYHATLLGDSRIADLVYWLLVLYPLAALRTVPRAILIRRFDFRAIALSSNAAEVAGGMTGVAFALAGAGVWALVVNQLAWSIAMTIGLLWQTRWWPNFRVSRNGFKGLGGFVPNAILSQASDFADYYLIRLLVGSRAGTEAVGYYAVSVDLRGLLRSLVVLPAAQTVLPSVRELKDDQARLRNALRIGIILVTSVAFPASIGFCLIAKDIVPLAIGAQWVAAVPLVQMMALTVPAMAITRVNMGTQYAFGKAGIVARLALTSTAVLATLLLAVPTSSAAGIVAILLFRSYVMLPLHLLQLRRTTGFRFRDAMQSILPNALATAFLAAAVLASQATFLADVEPFLRLLSSIGIGAVVYGIVLGPVAPSTFATIRAALKSFSRHRSANTSGESRASDEP